MGELAVICSWCDRSYIQCVQVVTAWELSRSWSTASSGHICRLLDFGAKRKPTLNILTWQPQPATPFCFQILLIVHRLQWLPNASQLERSGKNNNNKAGINEVKVFQAAGRTSAKAMKCTWHGFTEEPVYLKQQVRKRRNHGSDHGGVWRSL